MIQVLNTISAFVHLLGKLTAIVDIHRCFIIDPVFLSNMVDQSFFQPLLINLFKNLIIHRSHLISRTMINDHATPPIYSSISCTTKSVLCV